MKMLALKNISLVSIDCVNAIESINALLYSSKNINFKELILLTNEDIFHEKIKTIKIKKLLSVSEYNDFVLKLINYVDSDYILLIQSDGYILNHEMWNNNFLNFSYIGAAWTNDPTWIEKQKLKNYVNFVGNGGFSLRSRKFLELSNNFTTCHGFGEDVYLCNLQHNYMLAHGIKFAPVEVAERFSRENNLSDWTNPGVHDINSSFGFHGKNFSNFAELINLKNNI